MQKDTGARRPVHNTHMLLTSEKPNGEDDMYTHCNRHEVCGSHWKLFIILRGSLASAEYGNFVSPVCKREVDDPKHINQRDPGRVRHEHKHEIKHVGVALPERIFSALLTVHSHIRKYSNGDAYLVARESQLERK
jgi:hypothetical protein